MFAGCGGGKGAVDSADDGGGVAFSVGCCGERNTFHFGEKVGHLFGFGNEPCAHEIHCCFGAEELRACLVVHDAVEAGGKGVGLDELLEECAGFDECGVVEFFAGQARGCVKKELRPAGTRGEVDEVECAGPLFHVAEGERGDVFFAQGGANGEELVEGAWWGEVVALEEIGVVPQGHAGEIEWDGVGFFVDCAESQGGGKDAFTPTVLFEGVGEVNYASGSREFGEGAAAPGEEDVWRRSADDFDVEFAFVGVIGEGFGFNGDVWVQGLKAPDCVVENFALTRVLGAFAAAVDVPQPECDAAGFFGCAFLAAAAKAAGGEQYDCSALEHARSGNGMNPHRH